MKKRGLVLLLGVVVLSFILFPFALSSAADFPKKPITFIVPYSAGGRTDIIGRVFTQFFPKYVGQPSVIVNKPGAGAVLGTLEVIKAPADGYTLVIASTALIASKYTLPGQKELLKNLEPISRLDLDPMFLVVSEKTGVSTVRDLIALAKKNPKKIKIGAQQGSSTYLYTHAFTKDAGIEVTYIFFPGGGEAKTALAGGHIDLYFDAGYVYKPLVDGQKAKFLGVTAERRLAGYPNVPTLKEQGVDIVWGAWQGFFAPKGTPPEVLQVLDETIKKTVSDKSLVEMAEKNQIMINPLSGPGFVKFLENEDKTFRELAIEVGLYKPKQ